jgi:hypothetical protein
MTILEWVLLALVLGYTGSIVAVAMIARRLYKRFRRSRTVNGVVLRVRTSLSGGPRREVLRLRLRLHETLAGGQVAVDLAAQSQATHGELPRLFDRIHSEGVTLESQLRLMATETDPALLAEEIPVARRRVESVAGLVRQLRSVVADGLGEISDDALVRLRFDVEREVAALNAGLQELHTLNRNDAPFAPHRQPSMNRPNVERLSGGSKP